MGQFSFMTQDTNTSVSSMRKANVYMVAPDGTVYHEDNYEGYGEFGGKDIYELLSEINGGKSCRMEGIALAFNSRRDGKTRYDLGDNPEIVWPNLVRYKSNAVYDARRGHIKGCPDQGWT